MSLMRRTYSLNHPDSGVSLTLRCDGTVSRFAVLPINSFFLVGEDEEAVWFKTGTVTAMRVDTRDTQSWNANPWCEALEVVK